MEIFAVSSFVDKALRSFHLLNSMKLILISKYRLLHLHLIEQFEKIILVLYTIVTNKNNPQIKLIVNQLMPKLKDPMKTKASCLKYRLIQSYFFKADLTDYTQTSFVCFYNNYSYNFFSRQNFSNSSYH